MLCTGSIGLFFSLKGIDVKRDERILGNGEFVEKVLTSSQERYLRPYALKAAGIDLDSLAVRVAELLGLEAGQIWQAGKSRIQVKARSLLCYWAVRELGAVELGPNQIHS